MSPFSDRSELIGTCLIPHANLVRTAALRRTGLGWVLGVTALFLFGALSVGFGGGFHSTSAAPSATTPSNVATSAPSFGIGPHHLSTVPLHSTPPTQRVGLPQSSWLAYDHAYEAFYVAAPPSSVDIINAWTGGLSVNFTIPTGSDPFGVAVDNATGNVFVTNTGSDNVTVLQGDSAYPVANISVGSAPMGIAYDPFNGLVYVANSGSDSVTVLEGTTPYLVLNTVSVGLDPIGVGVAPSGAVGSKVFVADEAASNVTVLNGSLAGDPQYVVTTIGVGDEPYGVTYDNLTQDIYVTNQGSGNVSVLSSSTLSTVASIPVDGSSGELQGIAYDSANQTLWAGAGNLYIAVLDPATNTLSAAVNFDPSGVTYDPDNGNVCVTNTGNATFECISFTNPPSYPNSPTDAVTFQETGLPSGDPWSVGLLYGGPTENSTASTITFGA
ncbi:MAG: YncE family protein, partial [Thermoplasmata archaeon]|nr:YncE family protein [Thermoplasmata archaeon]